MKFRITPLVKQKFVRLGMFVMTLLGFAQSSMAQSASNYVFNSSISTYTQVNDALATRLNLVEADSYISPAQNIGFNFVFEGVTYTQFKMSSNGFISLGAGTAVLTTNDLSAANATSRPVIAPLWDDNDGRATGLVSRAFYELTGTAPNRVLTVEWREWEWRYDSNTPTISFQVKLYETTNLIEFVYRQEPGTFPSTPTASIGINSATGSGAGSYLNVTSVTAPAVSSTTAANSLATKPATGQVFTFAPPLACTGAPALGQTTATVTNACVGTPFTLGVSGIPVEAGYTYLFESSPAGTNTWTSLGTASSTATYSVASQSAPTDYRVTVTCTNSAQSTIATMVSIGQNLFYNCYCTPVSTCTNEGIENVTFSTINNSSTFCTNASGYTSYSALGSLASVNQGDLVPISVTAHINSNPANAGVWIDFNHNAAFEASEYTSLGSATVSIPTGGTTYIFTGNVPIDANALTGITRMRVRSANQAGITNTSSCISSGGFGEFEDYLITINTGTSCSGTPTAGTAAASVASVACSGAPFDLSATGYTIGVINLSFQWQESSNGMNFTDIGPATANYTPYTVPGISQAMAYRLQVSCSLGGGQNWSVPVTVNFSTPPIPWAEGFETVAGPAANVFPACWTRELVTGTNSPGTSTTNDTYRSPRTGTKYLYTQYNTTAWVYTPGFNLQAGISYDFSFYMMNKNVTSPVSFTMDVAYGTSANSAAMTNVLQTGYVPTNNTYQLFKYTFTPPATGIYNFGIKSTSPNTTPWYLSFDDFALDLTPSCPAPVFSAPSNITASTADISWAPVAAGSGYEYVLDQTAAAPTVAGTQYSGTTYNATGLNSNTTYYFHARTICGGSFSPWSTISFSTSIPNDVCSGAVVIPTAGPYTTAVYSNVNATDVSDPAITCQANSHKGVWFSFTPPATGSYTISTCQSAAPLSNITDNTLGVFTSAAGCSGPFTEVICDDDACTTLANQAVATTTLTQGIQYFIVVYGYNTNTGDVQVNISGSPLAVKLLDISATNAGSRNRVDWNTASEDLGDYFGLERSADGRNFTTLGTVTAKGTGSAYSYWDETPIAGTNYYRLKMMDAAGKSEYSKVVTAAVKGGAFTVSAYPNPVGDKLTITIHGTSGSNAFVTIADVTGKVVKTISLTDGKAEVDMKGMATGMYLVKYSDDLHNETIKVNKQ